MLVWPSQSSPNLVLGADIANVIFSNTKVATVRRRSMQN